jgi:hypothetical protein
VTQWRRPSSRGEFWARADAAFSGYAPLINGSDTNFSRLFVLTD